MAADYLKISAVLFVIFYFFHETTAALGHGYINETRKTTFKSETKWSSEHLQI